MKIKSFFLPLISACLMLGIMTTAQADPANKDAVAAATNMIIESVGFSCIEPGFPFLCTEESDDVVLLEDFIHAKNNGDYVMQVSMECFTGSYDVDSHEPYGFGIDYRRAFVQVWIEIDGVPVYDNAGKVIMCGDETFQLYIADSFETEPDLDVQLNRFGGAHAFNWPVLNLPHGHHLVQVMGRLQARVLGIDDIPDEGTMAGIGKRSLFINNIHAANGEGLGCDGLGCF